MEALEHELHEQVAEANKQRGEAMGLVNQMTKELNELKEERIQATQQNNACKIELKNAQETVSKLQSKIVGLEEAKARNTNFFSQVMSGP